MKLFSLKGLLVFVFFLIFTLIFLNKKNLAQESPYFYSCILREITPTVLPDSTILPTSEPTPATTLIPTPTSIPSCILKMGNGERSKADLVVLAEDYNSLDDFLAAVDKAVVALAKTNLGPTRLGKINLWAHTDLTQTYFQGYDCPTSGRLSAACWDHMKAFTVAASKCGGDSYLVFNNDTRRVGSIGGISIWGGTYIYNFALDEPTVPHELGHSLAGLMDEYSFGVEAPQGQIAGINCSEIGSANQSIPCPKWADKFPNVGCFQRCGYTNFFRPTDRSIMDRGGSGAVYEFNEPSLVDGWDEVLKFFH